jgi:hypothetical protein
VLLKSLLSPGQHQAEVAFINIIAAVVSMTKISYEDIKFSKEQGGVKLVFLRAFESHIDKEDLERIGRFDVKDGALEFPGTDEKAVNKRFGQILANSFTKMQSMLTGHRIVYVHRNSGIPLIGSLYFGIVDRGTNIIEVKPITGCNIDCVFCSVDEGKSSKKLVDFVVETDYLADGLRRVIEYKQEDKQEGKRGKELKIDVFINTHGEPLLYANIVELVRKIREIKQVNIISIITNGTLLTEKLTDELIEAGLNQMNMSINASNEDAAKKLAGTNAYNLGKVMAIAKYVAKKIKLVIAPVWVRGVNDEEITKLISFSKEIGADIGIQNYMAHRLGRKVAKQVEWEEFYRQLEVWEKYSGVSLKTTGHTLYATKPLEKPFKKGDVVKASLVCPGRMNKEMLAVAKGRVISVIDCNKANMSIKVRIVRDKDNVFVGEEA